MENLEQLARKRENAVIDATYKIFNEQIGEPDKEFNKLSKPKR